MQLISKETARFENSPVPAFRPCDDVPTLIAEHQREELAIRPEIDAIVRTFARNHRWPDILSVNEQYFIGQRLIIGFIICGYLATPNAGGHDPVFPQAPESFADEDQIEWLLISGWSSVGWRFWLNHQRTRLNLSRGKSIE